MERSYDKYFEVLRILRRVGWGRNHIRFLHKVNKHGRRLALRRTRYPSRCSVNAPSQEHSRAWRGLPTLVVKFKSLFHYPTYPITALSNLKWAPTLVDKFENHQSTHPTDTIRNAVPNLKGCPQLWTNLRIPTQHHIDTIPGHSRT